MIKNKNIKNQGITLIETITALFIITTGVFGLVAVSLFTMVSYDNSTKRVAALNLARESLEVVRMTRDSNWLTAASFAECEDLDDQPCHQDWLAGILTQCLNGCHLVFEDNQWSLSSGGPYGVFLQKGFYSPIEAEGSFYRKIVITADHAEEQGDESYTEEHPLLTVTSIVSWSSRNCDVPLDYDPQNAPEHCRLVLESQLTNWKNY